MLAAKSNRMAEYLFIENSLDDSEETKTAAPMSVNRFTRLFPPLAFCAVH
jgi:hypothetical protein